MLLISSAKTQHLGLQLLPFRRPPPTPPSRHQFHLHVFGEIHSRPLVLRFHSRHRKKPPLLFHTSRPALGLSQSPAEWESAASALFKHSSYPSTSSSSSSTTVRCRPWLPVRSSPFRPVSGHCVPAYSQYLQIIFSLITFISAVGICFSVFSLYNSKLTAHKVEKAL